MCSILEQGLDLLLQSERFRIGSSQFIKRWQDAEHRACMITEPLEEMMGDSSPRALVQFEVQQSRAQLHRGQDLSHRDATVEIIIHGECEPHSELLQPPEEVHQVHVRSDHTLWKVERCLRRVAL